GGTSSPQALANATVRLYAAGTGAPRLLGSAMSNGSGEFTISVPDSTTQVVRFVTTRMSSGIELAAVLGQSVPSSVTVNELTTVAAAFSFAQFFHDSDTRGDSLAWSIAAGMNANLVDPASGASSPVLLASPNADQTNSLRSTRNLANLIASCVQQP